MYHNTSILRRSPICLGATKNFTVLLSSASGVFLTRSMDALEDCSYDEITSASVAGAFGILPNSMPPSRALLAGFLLGHEYPGQLLRGLALGVRRQVCFGGGVGLEHLQRGGKLLLQRAEE